jgi:hypothetical protein
LQIESWVIILKTFGSCLVLVTVAIVLALPHWPMENVYAGGMRFLATKSQENILLAPSLIIYYQMRSLELLPAEPSLDPEPLETEASSQTQEEYI